MISKSDLNVGGSQSLRQRLFCLLAKPFRSPKKNRFFAAFFIIFSITTVLLVKFMPYASAAGSWVQEVWSGGVGVSIVNQYSTASDVGIIGDHFSVSKSEKFSNGDMESGINDWSQIMATGGTESTYIGDGTNGTLGVAYKVHSFTATGASSFDIRHNLAGSTVEALVVAGGGGAGYDTGGGGGGGGVNYQPAYSINGLSSVSVTVGAGGTAGKSSSNRGSNGGNSVFGSITTLGGGGGGSYGYGVANGLVGGSGGGGGITGSASGTGAQGTAGQGNNGGSGVYATSPTNYWVAGGGGGYASIGQNGNKSNGALGGSGLLSYITGTAKYYGCGGSAGAWSGAGNLAYTTDGNNCGGAGKRRDSGAVSTLQNGYPNTGGGGGGGGNLVGAGIGGSGVVIVRYPTSFISHSTERGFNSSNGSIKVDSTSIDNFVSQDINLGATGSYTFEAYAYKSGDSISVDDVQFMVDSTLLTTTFSVAAGNWYKMTAEVEGTEGSKSYGVLVKSGRTVYLDDLSLSQYSSFGQLTSAIYDIGSGAAWGLLDYSYSGDGEVEVRVRSSNQSNMSGATDWTECPAVISGSSLASSSCMVGNTRYVQYQVKLTPSVDLLSAPTFSRISISHSPWDQDPPEVNASEITMSIDDTKEVNIEQDGWTNNSTPYFSWQAAGDGEGGTGIKGYCLYLGADDTADFSQTKGILGNAPFSIDGKCQYIVEDEFLDLSVNTLATALSTAVGKYYLLIKAIDNGDNLYDGSAESFYFNYDDVPPNNPVYISAPSQFLSTEDFTLTWINTGSVSAGIYDADSGIAGLQYKIGSGGTWSGINHDGSAGDVIPNSGQYQSDPDHDYSLINEGNNTFYFRTIDNAGNISLANIVAVVRINSSSPSSPQNLVADPEINTENSFSFRWIAPSSYVGQASAITYCYTINVLPSVNNCNYTPAGQLSLSAEAYATQPGNNTFYVVAKDEAGNINYDTYASAIFKANTSEPGIPLNADISDVSVKATSIWKVAITWDSPTDVGAGVSKYQIYKSTDALGEFAKVAETEGTSYVDSGLSQVEYYYYIKACDSANNCGAPTNVVSMIPTGRYSSPAGLISNPSVLVSARKAIISWVTDRNSDSRVQYGVETGVYRPTEFAVSTPLKVHQVELSGLDAGTTYFYRAKWGDEDGNIGVSSELSFTTLPAPVVKDINVIKTSLHSATIQFTITGAVKANVYFGKSEEMGGLKPINTSAFESTYAIELDGLDDGSNYNFRIDSVDADGFSYTGNIFSFSTPFSPKISNLRFQPIDGEPTSTQKVTWLTNVPTTSVITYGITGTNGSDILNSELVTEHEIIVRGLRDNSSYFLLAQSRDTDGNLAVSDSQTFKTAMDTRPPKISNINTESVVRGNGAEASGQIIVSWTTDELATSQVAYGEGSDSTKLNSKTPEDSTLSTEHIVIISDLGTSRGYTVKPISYDRAGNESSGEARSAIINRATDSVMTLALNVLRKLFGF